MHPIVIYVMFKTRMELDREAERRRLARTDMARVLPAPADRRPPRKKWRAAMSIHPWIEPRPVTAASLTESAILASRMRSLRARSAAR